MRRLASRIRRTLAPRRPRPVILMYHRVADLEHDPWGLAVSPRLFEEQLKMLRERRTPLPMAEFIRLLRSGSLPQDAVAITFDDGYVDNLRHAKPSLAAAGLSATLFLSTGTIGRSEYFWWDELAALILDRRDAFDGEFELKGKRFSITFGPKTEDSRAERDWKAWEAPVTARQYAFAEIWSDIQLLCPSGRTAAMATVREIFGPAISVGEHRAMSAAEVRSIARGGTVELGGHTVNHPALPSLPHWEQKAEILCGKQAIETIVGTTIAGFAYPYGAVSEQARENVVESGFDWACTTEKGAVAPGSHDIFMLPRLGVGQWSGAALERELLHI